MLFCLLLFLVSINPIGVGNWKVSYNISNGYLSCFMFFMLIILTFYRIDHLALQFTILPDSQLSFSALKILKNIFDFSKEFLKLFLSLSSFNFSLGSNLSNTDLTFLADISSVDDILPAILEFRINLYILRNHWWDISSFSSLFVYFKALLNMS